MVCEWLLPSHAAAAICTGGQSLLKAIQNSSADTADPRSMLSKRAGKTALFWMPGHQGIACDKQAAVITDGAPLPQPEHSSVEHKRTHHFAIAEKKDFKPLFSRLTPIRLTHQLTIDALVAERSHTP